MGMRSREVVLKLNSYDCDFCASGQSIYQPSDQDSYAVPKGWVAKVLPGHPHATIGEVKCLSCVQGQPHIIEGQLAEGVPNPNSF